MIKYCWDWVAYCFMLIYWAVTSIFVSLLGTLLYLILPPKYALAIGRLLIQKDFQLFIFILKITGLLILEDEQLKALAERQGAMIVAPNHIALWDVVFIVAQVPKLIIIMKESILKNPLFGGQAGRLAGYIPVNSISQMIKLARQCLLKNNQLLMFPEGTRTKTDAQWMNQIQGGVALLAKQTSVPIIPVYIRSNSRFFEKGWPLYKKPVFPLRMSVHVGEPVVIRANESAQEFVHRLEGIYHDELSKPHSLRRKS
ncbi:lysophospholipid acyltransferase family protein [Bathymodiolus japonicus methanotrophic gill symbiont]|uniref:lysophospholipid acyltransferase family protein n=1 Tax=Bathymodiolus japonicus methanotrophic gill symbiont TaxID=113269 RepID=UPI001C8D5879|nr:lysophospholipid acyltransferase family protein [Bathymodiolus japonicus methanotrophic gill symbiont]